MARRDAWVWLVALGVGAAARCGGEGGGDHTSGADEVVLPDAAGDTSGAEEVAPPDAVGDAPLDGEAEDALGDEPGVAAWLVAIERAEGEGGAGAFTLGVEADGLSYELGAGPTFYRIAAPGDQGPTVRLTGEPWQLAPGERRTLEPARLLAWAPGVEALELGLELRRGDAVERVALTIGIGTAARSRVELGGAVLVIEARRGLAFAEGPRIGLTVDRQLEPSDLAARVRGPIAIKHYSGARRWLLRPGCDSDEACAEGGAAFPCVERCACRCDAAACDCDFAALEAVMRDEATAKARRVLGQEASDEELSRARIHWVFKRSLGGTGACASAGELDVDAQTWGRFFAAATRAAIAVNEAVGFRLIDVLSPMNEVNHPLQDGAHVNAAGQPTLAGLIAFGELIRRASCRAGTCCAHDRHIVAAPPVPALCAAAMVAAGEVLEEAASPLAPEVALSLYLDVEQRDPLQQGPDGEAPAIVTPVGVFMRQLVDALDGRTFPRALVVVDTYPGSWGAPWFEARDGVIHHMDPERARVVRVEPVVAADQVMARAAAALDEIERVIGARPAVFLGEVGWSTFDGDEAAQASFARRLIDTVAAARGAGEAVEGLIWFKTHDRAPFGYPTWTHADNPLGGPPVACDEGLIGAVFCAADVLARMEDQWGLARIDGTRKPAWDALIARWGRLAEGAAP